MSDRLLVAIIRVDAVDADLDWVTDDDDPRWRTIDSIDLPSGVLSRLFELYRSSFQRADRDNPSGEGLFKSPEELLKYDRVFLICTGEPPAQGLPDAGTIVGFALCRALGPGIKLGLMGSDRTLPGDERRAARDAILDLVVGMLNVDGVFAEVSDPLETKLMGRVRVVPFADAKQVLAELGKHDARNVRDAHYERTIGRIGKKTKLMVGKPKLPRPRMAGASRTRRPAPKRR